MFPGYNGDMIGGGYHMLEFHRVRSYMIIPRKSISQYIIGPSDRDRTCGLMVPNHALYQLGYTRKYVINDVELQDFHL